MKKYYIKERHNPQLGIYYVLENQLTKKEAESKEKSLYGTNYMHSYNTFEEYKKAIQELKDQGHKIQ
jgi:hypothetical protein